MIKLKEKVKNNLQMIKNTKGVENVVLTQRDGNPIQYAGVWFSKSEIFDVSAATSAIYNCGLQLHKNNLKFILIEGKKAKILLSPLKSQVSSTLNKIIQAQNLDTYNNEFFVAITTQHNVNLGGILLKTRKSLIDINKSLILSGESFKPPLRHFSEKEILGKLNSSNVKDELTKSNIISYFNINVSQKTNIELNKILRNFSSYTLDLINTFITFEGGFVAASYIKEKNKENIDSEASMSNVLFSTSEECAWLLKKMHVRSILLECTNYFQFIYKIEDSIFSSKIAKGRQKLGLLRLILPRYCKKIGTILKDSKKENKNASILNFKEMFSEIIL